MVGCLDVELAQQAKLDGLRGQLPRGAPNPREALLIGGRREVTNHTTHTQEGGIQQ